MLILQLLDSVAAPYLSNLTVNNAGTKPIFLTNKSSFTHYSFLVIRFKLRREIITKLYIHK